MVATRAFFPSSALAAIPFSVLRGFLYHKVIWVEASPLVAKVGHLVANRQGGELVCPSGGDQRQVVDVVFLPVAAADFGLDPSFVWAFVGRLLCQKTTKRVGGCCLVMGQTTDLQSTEGCLDVGDLEGEDAVVLRWHIGLVFRVFLKRKGCF